MRLALGRILATPGALEALGLRGVSMAVYRHAVGDWGDVDDEDREANEAALAHGDRVVSRYGEIYVITEGDRSSTCVMLRSEY
ncbi:MAG: hypothetical protein KF764_31560 [Labilithrix sp.]|nr:hypothetical protein [Labilithrix sp.]